MTVELIGQKDDVDDVEYVVATSRVTGLSGNMDTRNVEVLTAMGERAKLGRPFNKISRLVAVSVTIHRDTRPMSALVSVRYEERPEKRKP